MLFLPSILLPSPSFLAEKWGQENEISVIRRNHIKTLTCRLDDDNLCGQRASTLMITQTQIQTPRETTERNSSADSVLGYAVLGLFTVGGVGLIKALEMDRASDVLLCLLGSTTAFGAVLFMYLRRH